MNKNQPSINSELSNEQLEKGMKILLEGTDTLRGEKLFRYFVQHISKLLAVKYVVINSIEEGPLNLIKPLVMWEDGHVVDIFEYDVAGTPCELILKNESILFVDEYLYKKFPKDTYLKKNCIVSYYGLPFFDPMNKLLGHLYIMDDQFMTMEPWMESLMKLFARSIGSELERISKDRKLSLLNDSLELKVNERTLELSKAIEELDAFFYRASHDIRGPIVTLQTIYELVINEKSPSDSKLFQLLGSQIFRLKNLNNSLLEVGEIRAHKIEKKDINLHELISSIVESLLISDNAEVNLNIDKKAVVCSDAYLLEIILRVIIENSISYSKSDQTNCIVNITLERSIETDQIKIIDNGCGIPLNSQKDLYSMFFRANLKSGVGLGLYKAKMASEKIHVNLILRSENSEGTEAVIIFNETKK